MSPRLAPPAASFIREHEVVLGDLRLRAGIDRPTEIEGWWLAVLWVADRGGIRPCRLGGAAAGRPAGSRPGPQACPRTGWRTWRWPRFDEPSRPSTGPEPIGRRPPGVPRRLS